MVNEPASQSIFRRGKWLGEEASGVAPRPNPSDRCLGRLGNVVDLIAFFD